MRNVSCVHVVKKQRTGKVSPTIL